jgi:hypothetical protein
MTKFILLFILQVAVLAVPASVLASPQGSRCATDSLDPDLAIQRVEWARKCGLLRNTAGPSSWFESGAALDLASNPAKEYREIDPDRAFSGNADDFNVNLYHGSSLFMATPKYSVTQETSGPTSGYWKWSHTVRRAHPLYPTFETSPVAGAGTPLLPLPTIFNDCNLYQWDQTAGTLTPWTGSFYVVAYCESGCYAPDQNLRFSDGDVNIVDAMKARRDDLVTLSPDATLDKLTTQTSRVASYTTEIRDAENVIYTLTTASGGSLSVTSEHPILTSEGRLVQAQKLLTGDELLKADGTADPITRIEKTTRFGKVYNIKPVSPEPIPNILIAQGYLVGSARFQNDDVAYINRILLFRTVPEEVMPR